jgi:hypothetical protein
MEGGGDYIISGDHYLTDLKAYQGIKIVDPATFLSRWPTKNKTNKIDMLAVLYPNPI